MKKKQKEKQDACSSVDSFSLGVSILFSLLFFVLLYAAYAFHPLVVVCLVFVYAFSVFAVKEHLEAKRKNTEKILGLEQGVLFGTAFNALAVCSFFVILALYSGEIGHAPCPEKAEGNLSASLKVFYFQSPFCYICYQEKPKQASWLSEYGSDFAFYTFDMRYCGDLVKNQGFYGTPAYLVKNGNKTVAKVLGQFSSEQFKQMLCKETGNEKACKAS